MDIKTISVHLTREERAALYETATRECRLPEQQVRFLLRQALGISDGKQSPSFEETKNDAGVRQDLASAVPS